MSCSQIFFRWTHGVELNWLITEFNRHVTSESLVAVSYDGLLLNRFNLEYEVPGGLLRCEALLPQPDFVLDPKCCREIMWRIAPHGIREYKSMISAYWGACAIRRDDDGDPLLDSFVGDKVKRLKMHIRERLAPWAIDEQTLPSVIEKYEKAKELFVALDCDVVDAVTDHYNYLSEGEPCPEYEDRIFRFAKKGRNILHRALEERRLVTEEELSDFSWRVVLDG